MAEYIDREALIDCLRKGRSEIEIREDDDKAFNLGVHQGYVFAIHDAKSIPAADVRPVVRAYLVSPNPYGECSNCGFLIDIRDNFHFCPNCGAFMRNAND